MVKAVAAFARTGNPNGEGLPIWPLFKGGQTVMLWDTPTAGVYDASRYHRCDFWRQLYPQELSVASTTQPGASERA
jgi:carboxylesterase type B